MTSDSFHGARVRRLLGRLPCLYNNMPNPGGLECLGGVMVITGKWQDGAPMLAIPNFARMNHIGLPPAYPSERSQDELKGTLPIESKVWI